MPRCCMILLSHASLQQHFRSRIGRIPLSLWRRRIWRRFCLLICLNREEKDLSSVALPMHMCWWYGHKEILCWFYVDLNNAPIFGVPRDRGVLIVQPTRLSLHNTLLRWDICWKWLEDLCVGDDQSVLSNTMYQGSTCLKKKCAAAAVAFHFVREGVTREEAIDNRSIFMKCWLSAWKSMTLGAKRSAFVEKILQFISDGVRSD